LLLGHSSITVTMPNGRISDWMVRADRMRLLFAASDVAGEHPDRGESVG
jgi:hypothetical protein